MIISKEAILCYLLLRRASIEQDYGERLLKLAQNSRIGEFEEDTFAETLLRIPSALETTARAHIDLAQQMKDHLEVPLGGFLKDQRDVRKVVKLNHIILFFMCFVCTKFYTTATTTYREFKTT